MLDNILKSGFNSTVAMLFSFLFSFQVHGGMGMCQDTPLAQMYAGARSLRIADGPDVVHLETVAKLELQQQLAKL